MHSARNQLRRPEIAESTREPQDEGAPRWAEVLGRLRVDGLLVERPLATSEMFRFAEKEKANKVTRTEYTQTLDSGVCRGVTDAEVAVLTHEVGSTKTSASGVKCASVATEKTLAAEENHGWDGSRPLVGVKRVSEAGQGLVLGEHELIAPQFA